MSARPKTRNVARRLVDPVRLVPFQVLRAVDEQDAYANLVLPRALREARLTGRDAAFATDLAYGTLRLRGTYDAIIAACTTRPLAEVDAAVLDALRLGVHQLLSMRVPAHAGVDVMVNLVRSEIGQGAAGFANAVLRSVTEHDLAEWVDLVAPDRAAEPDGYLAIAQSHPIWIVRALRDALVGAGRPAGELPDLLAANNLAPSVSAVALPGLISVESLIAAGAQPGTLSPLAVRLTGSPGAFGAVRDGRARVQDEGSQLVALALASATLHGPDGGRWLDLCAGPGGKAALLGATVAERVAEGTLPADARLEAVESASHRADLVRVSVSGVEHKRPGTVAIRVADGRDVGQETPGGYDRVLLDAPCTGLGALRRRPEARWRRTPADLAALATLQRALLASALDAVRPGGVVGYVTCSPHRGETKFVVDDVIKRRTDIERLDAAAVVSAVTGGSIAEPGTGPDVQLWPHVHGTDAMYLALLRRA